ncbi:hypothetical protein HanIR_Chr01g0026611 [Helianthus annuus]|nr:hypothetical protein HanIR_Chr01g0026611 [Helianthus annuus]
MSESPFMKHQLKGTGKKLKSFLIKIQTLYGVASQKIVKHHCTLQPWLINQNRCKTL